MSAEIKSFFDDTEAKNLKKIWEKVPKDRTEQKHIKAEIATEFIKVMKKRESKKAKQRYLLIEENKLYMCKSENKQKISGALDLYVCKCEWIFVEKAATLFKNVKAESLYGFRISRNGKSIEVYTEYEEIFKQWKKKLSQKTFQTVFHEEYQVTKMIGKQFPTNPRRNTGASGRGRVQLHQLEHALPSLGRCTLLQNEFRALTLLLGNLPFCRSRS